MSDKQPANSDHASEQAEVTWATLPEAQQEALIYIRGNWTITRHMFEKLERKGLAYLHVSEKGDKQYRLTTRGITVLDQRYPWEQQASAPASDASETTEAAGWDINRAYEEVVYKERDLHLALCAALGIQFDSYPSPDIYTEAIETIRQQLADAQAANRALKDTLKDILAGVEGNRGNCQDCDSVAIVATAALQAATDGSASAASADDENGGG